MAKPTYPEIVAGDESWDAQLESWRTILTTGIPIPNYDDVASLPAVASYEDSLALADVNNDADYVGKVAVLGIDGAWTKLANQCAEVAALVDNGGGSSGSGTIAAVTDVATAADAIATLAEQVNALLTAMKAAGAMASS